MELETFVSEALVQICKGIKEAQNSTEEYGGIISPACEYANDGYLVCTKSNMIPSVPSVVHFDVLVTSDENQSRQQNGKKGASITVLSATLSLDTDNGHKENHYASNSSASRIQFDVRVKWPEIQVYGNLSKK